MLYCSHLKLKSPPVFGGIRDAFIFLYRGLFVFFLFMVFSVYCVFVIFCVSLISYLSCIGDKPMHLDIKVYISISNNSWTHSIIRLTRRLVKNFKIDRLTIGQKNVRSFLYI